MNNAFLTEHNATKQYHPMGHPNKLDAHPPIIINQGDGVFITDINGNRMVDGVGGLWNVNVGYNRPEIKQAIMAQLDELPYYSAFNGTTHPRAIELSVKLMEMLEPEGMRRVMFSSGGSDAVETALKVARQYWKLLGQKDRYKFISLRYGYHGTHFGGASVNGNYRFRRNYEPMLPGCFQIDAPHLYRNPYTDDPQRLGELCAELLDREIEFQGADTVAAFIAEPVQGAGGVIVPPANYWPLVREVCDKHGVLLISDEVVTGFGRTGSMFGARAWGVKPDMMCLAKGISSGYIPLGATVVNERIEDAFKSNNDFSGAIMHGYTYTGHPVACAASLATLDIVINEDLPSHAGQQGEYLISQLKPFEDKFNMVGNVRGKGLMVGVELVADKNTKAPLNPERASQVAKIARAEGAFVRIAGHMMILSPPLVIEEPELDIIVNALDVAFSELDH